MFSLWLWAFLRAGLRNGVVACEEREGTTSVRILVGKTGTFVGSFGQQLENAETRSCVCVEWLESNEMRLAIEGH